jgi:hypothetical protein
VVGDREDGDAVSLGGLGFLLERVDAVEEFLLQEDESTLSVLEGALVSTELGEDGTGVEMGVGWVVNLLKATLYLEGLLEVLEGGVELQMGGRGGGVRIRRIE